MSGRHWVDELVRDLATAGFLDSEEAMIGAVESEIDRVLADQGAPEYPSYRALMKQMGKKSGTFLQGTDWLLPHRFKIKEAAQATLEENGCEDCLSHDALVFMMHQGYTFWFLSYFAAVGDWKSPDGVPGEVPCVYFYTEGCNEIRKEARTLPDFMRQRFDLLKD